MSVQPNDCGYAKSKITGIWMQNVMYFSIILTDKLMNAILHMLMLYFRLRGTMMYIY